jgi:hypothetical protein
LGLAGARIIYSVAKAISNVNALDLSDNDFRDEGKCIWLTITNRKLGIAVLAEGLCSCKGVNTLILDRNFTKGKSKNFSGLFISLKCNLMRLESIEGLSKMVNSVDCSISALSIAGGNKSQLKGELVPFILSLTQNTKLTSLDISGHSMGASGTSTVGLTILTVLLRCNSTQSNDSSQQHSY